AFNSCGCNRSNQLILLASVNFHVGRIQSYCGRDRVLVFPKVDEVHPAEVRFAETETFQVRQGYILQAELVIDCQPDVPQEKRLNRIDERTFHLEIQYSTNHGRTWQQISKVCFPGQKCGRYYHQASILYASKYRKWLRTIGPLREQSWSNSTRLRIVQTNIATNNFAWAVDKVYMGPGCPNFCHGHGLCRNGACICDAGYGGTTCLPESHLPDFAQSSFEDTGSLHDWKTVGARVVTQYSNVSNVCGPMVSSGFLHLSGPTLRKLQSPDLDIQSGGTIQFYLQIGGPKCNDTLTRSNGVILQYSTNGGAMWNFIQEFYYSAYPTPTFINIPIPTRARTHHTRFRWWQPKNKGLNRDTWALDDVFIGERMMKDEIRLHEEDLHHQIPPLEGAQLREGAAKDSTFTTFSNNGNWGDFCDPLNGSFVFNKLKGDRFAMTRDMLLKPGDTIQFQINIGCTGVFSFESPVRLEYSHDGGHTWGLRGAMQPNPSHLCTGSSRELHEATQYHAGDYEGWTTVVIPVLSAIAEAPARFRWIQSVGNMSRTPVDWAIHNVYIGPSCVNRCEGNGICSYDLFYQPHCICNDGYQMDGSGSCHPKGQNPNGFLENFIEFSIERWQAKGGEISRGCGVVKSGNSMYFGGEGTRKLQTKPINTTNTRLEITFRNLLGSSENSEYCLASTTRDEAVVFQYSNDNGITWELIKELYFDIYQDQPVLVRLDIPLKAKTKNTIFRWWQPLPRNGLQRAQWALDGVIFGRPNLLENGFFDDF
uniref:Reelin n=1 Tax=Ciona savignyi TaxID=51511 RepID=H2Y860_CIOSA